MRPKNLPKGDLSDEEQADNVKVIMNIQKEGSVTGAIKKVDGTDKTWKPTQRVQLPPIDNFLNILEKVGVTEFTLAKTLKKLLKADKHNVDTKGNIHVQPDNNVRLKAVELLLRYYIPTEKKSDNHLHLHGNKLDELLKQ